MNLKTLFTVNTVIAVLFGLAFIFLPAQTLGLYTVKADPVHTYLAQIFGAALIAFATISWQARIHETDARRMAVLGFFVGDAIGFVATLIGQLSGVVNALGWTTVAIYLLLATGFGYFQFTNPE